jgi:hypothetical protein
MISVTNDAEKPRFNTWSTAAFLMSSVMSAFVRL